MHISPLLIPPFALPIPITGIVSGLVFNPWLEARVRVLERIATGTGLRGRIGQWRGKRVN